MTTKGELLESLAAVAEEVGRLRAEAGESLRRAVGEAADQGLTQSEIARAIDRSQPEVSRLLKGYRARKFRPTSPLGGLLMEHRQGIIALAREHHATNVRVFGSVARGQDDGDSDIDLLVDLEQGADLIDLAALDIELEKLLGHPVDVVPARLLNSRTARSALADAVAL